MYLLFIFFNKHSIIKDKTLKKELVMHLLHKFLDHFERINSLNRLSRHDLRNPDIQAILSLHKGTYKNKCIALFQHNPRWPKFEKNVMAGFTWGWIHEVLCLLTQMFREEFKRKTLLEQRKLEYFSDYEENPPNRWKSNYGENTIYSVTYY